MEIWQLTATEVAGAVRTGLVSAEEVTRSALDRVTAVNPAVNALVEVREQAIEEARQADELRRSGETLGALHGLPVTSKMNTNVEGLPTTDAVAAYADHVAPETDPQVASLLRAGAILIGRTNCPPFATRWTTESDLYGATLNPFDPGVTPGGSSGGAAAAVATGMGVLAQGNDIGGSLRYPAACCGVIGLRPSAGRIPGWAGPVAFDPPMAYQAFVEQGPIARTVADVRLGLIAMEAYDARDPRAVASVSRIPGGSGRPRIGVVTDPGGGGLRGSSTPAAVAATRRAAEWLADAGYQVEEVDQPIFGEASRLWWELALTEFAIAVRAEVARVGEPGYRRFFDYMFDVYEQEFGEVDLPQFVAGWAKRGRLRRAVSVFMDHYPLILMPVSGEPPFLMGADAESAERLAEIMSHQWPSMSVPVLGLPALGMPAEVSADGAPLGVQIVGRPFEDEAVLAAGEVIEARLGLSRPVEPRLGDR